MPFRIPLPAHFAILAGVLGTSAALSTLVRQRTEWGPAVRYSLAAFLSGNELIWYAYRLRVEGFRFPDELPLQLCDLSLWLTVIAALTLSQRVYEVAYLGGIGGSAMALLTPDLWAPPWSYPTAYFFLSHGFLMVTLLTLTAGKLARPQPGCIWRAFAALNLYAAAIGLFDAVFRTNYMYLRVKPVSHSLLDYFGPWPGYILAEEIFALGVFSLLWLAARSSPSNSGFERR